MKLGLLGSVLFGASLASSFGSSAFASPSVVYEAEPPRRESDVSVRVRENEEDITRYRSSVRVGVGPAFAIGGDGARLGASSLVEIGSGPVHWRMVADWMKATNATEGPLYAHYLGEIALDTRPRAAWHPVAGITGGAVYNGQRDWIAPAIGLRAGLEYAFATDGADVRVAISSTGLYVAGPSSGIVPELVTTAAAVVGF